jgi:lipopolysaccharide transport system ATP-binding protein
MPVLKVENLSKLYRLGEVGTGTISHDLNRWWARMRGKEDPYAIVGQTNDRSQKAASDYVWALKDINFEVEQGEILGIIGRNGAGKSTLLKILSQITSPTTGTIKTKGRIASLLEVGTGMHPEMTARENIYLNGAILGMTKKEIAAKFDEIIDFSGCTMYVDTPLKRFSSGMRVRLGFAVAAFLEPEILIVDEVLAVGDAEFQKKAIGKMKDISSGGGRTVLFVSHNMASVKSLCTRGIVLENGGLVYDGETDEAVSYYQNEGSETHLFVQNENIISGNDKIKIISFEVKPLNGNVIDISSGLEFSLGFINFVDKINLDVTFELRTIDDTVVFHHGTIISQNKDAHVGEYSVKGRLPGYTINSGHYKFKIIFGENQRFGLFSLDDLVSFEVLNVALGSNSGRLPGMLRPDIRYEINSVNEN